MSELQHQLFTKEGYIIDKTKIDERTLNKLIKNLTVKPKVNKNYQEEIESYPIYRTNGNFLYIPKFFGIETFGDPVATINTEGIQTKMKFTGAINSATGSPLKEHQIKVFEECFPKIQNDGGGILSLYCGAGKTVLALYIACVLNVKTLVVVHKTFLQNQWYDRIRQFTNAKVGIIRQNKVDVKNRDIVVGMMQSISMKDYDQNIFSDFGFVIYDECLTGDMFVATDKGNIKIEKLYELWQSQQKVPAIKSYNEKTKQFEYKQMTHAWITMAKEIYTIEIDEIQLKCTAKHKFLTTNGYIEAKDLTPNHVLVCSSEQKITKTFSRGLSDDQMQIVYGGFLGRGNLRKTKNKSVYYVDTYDITKESKYGAYYEWKASMFSSNLADISGKMYFVSKPFHLCGIIEDKNSCPNWMLKYIDLRGIAIWIMDRGTKKKSIIRAKNSFDEVSQKYIIRKLQSFDIVATYKKVGNSYCIVFDERNSIILSRKIYSYLHKNMIEHIITKKPVLTNSYNWDNVSPYNTTKLSKISINNLQQNKSTSADIIIKTYDIEVKDNHNFIVLDKVKNATGVVVHNCHHMASKVHSNVLNKTAAKYTLGLSATPDRSDGLTKILHWYIGNVMCKLERGVTNKVIAKVFYYNSSNPLFREKKRWIQGKMRPDTVKMITNITQIKERNKFIISVLSHLYCQEERKILVLSSRVNHLKKLKKKFDAFLQKEIEGERIVADEYTTGLYIGGMKHYELADSAECDVIFATDALAEEGLDISGLNTIILTTSKRKIVQAIGRIMRKKLAAGDIFPLIVDIADDLSVFRGQSDERDNYYKRSGYTREHYYANNKILVSHEDYCKLYREDEYEEGDFSDDYIADLQKILQVEIDGV